MASIEGKDARAVGLQLKHLGQVGDAERTTHVLVVPIHHTSASAVYSSMMTLLEVSRIRRYCSSGIQMEYGHSYTGNAFVATCSTRSRSRTPTPTISLNYVATSKETLRRANSTVTDENMTRWAECYILRLIELHCTLHTTLFTTLRGHMAVLQSVGK